MMQRVSVNTLVVVVVVWGILATAAANLDRHDKQDADGRDRAQSSKERLTLTEASPQRIKGQYVGSGERGISFEVDINEGHHSLTISTQDQEGARGERVLATKQHFLEDGTPMGISLFDNHFLVSNASGRKEYLVPRPFHRYFEHTLKRADLFQQLRKHLDEKGANETRTAAIGQFLASDEAVLVVQAAKALGERGMKGTDSPAAMMFYILASRVQNLLNKTLDKATLSLEQEIPGELDEDGSRQQREVLVERTARNVHGRTQSEDFCENIQHSCPSGRCPQGSECTGLCGMSCDCWDWVCGNCCLNKMCLDHDKYCTEGGFMSWCCFGERHKRS